VAAGTQAQEGLRHVRPVRKRRETSSAIDCRNGSTIFSRARAARKISTMNTRLIPAVLVALTAAASPSLALESGATSETRASAPVLQGQKAWDFLAPSPAASPRAAITTGSTSVRARGADARPAR